MSIEKIKWENHKHEDLIDQLKKLNDTMASIETDLYKTNENILEQNRILEWRLPHIVDAINKTRDKRKGWESEDLKDDMYGALEMD